MTLLEVAVATLLLVTMMGLAVPNMVTIVARYRLEMAARQLAADLREVQQQALMTEGTYAGADTTYYVQFDPTNDLYRLHRGMTAYRTVRLPPTVDLVGTNFKDSDGVIRNSLRFSGSGRPGPGLTGPSGFGGHVSLQDRVSGERRYVIVAGVTGRIRIDRVPPSDGEEVIG